MCVHLRLQTNRVWSIIPAALIMYSVTYKFQPDSSKITTLCVIHREDGMRRSKRRVPYDARWTYGPFSTLMERILLKPLSMMFWHSSMNSQRLPWKFSSSQTVILNWPICSIC